MSASRIELMNDQVRTVQFRSIFEVSNEKERDGKRLTREGIGFITCFCLSAIEVEITVGMKLNLPILVYFERFSASLAIIKFLSL